MGAGPEGRGEEGENDELVRLSWADCVRPETDQRSHHVTRGLQGVGGVREEEEEREAPHAPGCARSAVPQRKFSARGKWLTESVNRASGCVRPALRAWREALRFAPCSDGVRRGRRTRPATFPAPPPPPLHRSHVVSLFRSPCSPAHQQEGWLQKLGEVGIASWKKRWFILDERPPEPKCASAPPHLRSPPV